MYLKKKRRRKKGNVWWEWILWPCQVKFQKHIAKLGLQDPRGQDRLDLGSWQSIQFKGHQSKADTDPLNYSLWSPYIYKPLEIRMGCCKTFETSTIWKEKKKEKRKKAGVVKGFETTPIESLRLERVVGKVLKELNSNHFKFNESLKGFEQGKQRPTLLVFFWDMSSLGHESL